MNCDMCGASSELFLTKVEGSTLKLCAKCSGYGSVIKSLAPKIIPKKTFGTRPQQKQRFEETEQAIVEDYSTKIKARREKIGIKQDELAKKINEKESVIHKIETGHLMPDLKLAKKIESFLNITLIEEIKLAGQVVANPAKQSENLTLGDIIKIRKR